MKLLREYTHTHTGSLNNSEEKGTSLKNEIGITLVALIVTIIVLLILAGISIASLTGNGLFNKTKQAKEKYSLAEVEEHIKTIIYEKSVEKEGKATLQDVVDGLDEDEKYEYEIILGEEAKIKGKKPTIENVNSITIVYRNFKFILTSDLKLAVKSKEKTIDTGDREISFTLDNDLITWLNKVENKIVMEDFFDNQIINKLMQSENAVNYMLSNENIKNKILQNKNGVEYIFNNELSKNKVILDSNWTNTILNNANIIDSMKNNKNVVMVPKLSSNTSNVLVSSQYNNSDYWGGYKAFDGVVSSGVSAYHWTSSSPTNQYIGYKFDSPVWMFLVEIYDWTAKEVATNPKDVMVQASQDGENWNEMSDIVTLEETKAVQSIPLKNYNQKYQYWRLYIYNGYYSSYVGIPELKFYGF